MIPLVAYAVELETQRELAERVWAEENPGVDATIGTMIELPRAALTADQVAKYADFFSFGTNDLTQTTVGISRDDAEASFLSAYQDMGVVPANPFGSIDADGVAQLVEMGVNKGRSTKPGLKCGVCGEHGGDPASIQIFNKIGLDYVSCSPYRIPIARLAAARAVLGSEATDK
jgi:pyruvate,orthophosphate dikinase